MALTKCTDCGSEVSTLAERCPNCNTILDQSSENQYSIINDFGKEVTFDKNAFVELVEGAETGDVDNCMILGMYYLQKGELQKARDTLAPAMEKGSVIATYNLSKIERILARRNPENPKHLEWRRKFLESTAKADYAPAQNDLALLIHKEEPARAFELANSAVQGELSKASYTLGMFFRNGIGVPPDSEKALKYLLAAGNNEVENSYLPLARIYARGDGTAANSKTAAEWYSKAAECDEDDLEECFEFFKEHPELSSQLENVVSAYEVRIAKGETDLAGFLGIALFKHTEHRKTPHFLELAAQHGNAEAMYWLSGLYKTDTEERKRKAEQLRVRSAELGFTQAQLHVGAKLFESNPSKAFELISAAAETGSLEGLFHLATFYLMGVGVDEDLSKYAKLIQKVADEGYTPAFSEAGRMYKIGIGVTQDPRAARHWLEKALEHQADEDKQHKIIEDLRELDAIERQNADPGKIKIKRAGKKDEAPYAEIVIWGKSQDAGSWHRYGCLAPGEAFTGTLSPGKYKFRACVGEDFDEDDDDHEEGDDYEDIKVDLESHDDIKLVAKAWVASNGNLYVDFEKRT